MAPQDGGRGGDREETVRAPQGKRPGLRPGGSASRGREARKSLVFARPRAAPRGVYAAGKAHLSLMKHIGQSENIYSLKSFCVTDFASIRSFEYQQHLDGLYKKALTQGEVK